MFDKLRKSFAEAFAHHTPETPAEIHPEALNDIQNLSRELEAHRSAGGGTPEEKQKKMIGLLVRDGVDPEKAFAALVAAAADPTDRTKVMAAAALLDNKKLAHCLLAVPQSPEDEQSLRALANLNLGASAGAIPNAGAKPNSPSAGQTGR